MHIREIFCAVVNHIGQSGGELSWKCSLNTEHLRDNVLNNEVKIYGQGNLSQEINDYK